jgi:drug/metabolite transporter (DMT)-like permease
MYVVSSATFAAIPPVTLGTAQLAVGVAVLLVIVRGRLGIVAGSLPRVVATGVIFAVTNLSQFVGTSLTSGAEAAILTTTTPVFVLLFAVTLERERVHRGAWAGAVIALAGVAVLAFRGGAGEAAGATILGVPSRLVGDGLLLCTAGAWALFSTVGRPVVESAGGFRAFLQGAAVALLITLPLVPLELAWMPVGSPPPAAFAAIAYIGVASTAIGCSLWYRGYASVPPTVSAAAFFAQPIVGAVLGIVVLGEAVGSAFIAGSGLIAAGTLVIVAVTGRGIETAEP